MVALVVSKESPLTRDELATRLSSEGIQTRTLFCPMNKQPFLRAQPGFRDIPTPVADELWESGLYLPSSHNLSEETIHSICERVIDIFDQAA